MQGKTEIHEIGRLIERCYNLERALGQVDRADEDDTLAAEKKSRTIRRRSRPSKGKSSAMQTKCIRRDQDDSLRFAA